MTLYMVRAGNGGEFVEDFVNESIVAIRWKGLGSSVKHFHSRDELKQAIRNNWSNWKDGRVNSSAGQLLRFANDFQKGDKVITYDSSSRLYYIGEITSDYKYKEDAENDFINYRKVKWNNEPVDRDSLSPQSKNRLGSTLTIFKVPEFVENELLSVKTGKPQVIESDDVDDVESEAEEYTLEGVENRANEAIKDKIANMHEDDIPELVAGLLRAMGYKTKVSGKGSDRGKDIIASPDGLGLTDPRIYVEVKHRTAKMSSPEIRSFLGGRKAHDRCVYVSTGGFTKDGMYEAERATIPITLVDIDDLVDLLLEHYDGLDTKTRAMLPLAKIYYPVD